MDEMVQRAQRFINSTYSNGAKLGISKLTEDGRTGWTTMYALTRALQYEMGLTSLSDTFGPTTLNTLTSKYPSLNASTVPSWIFGCILQSALYCKGYDGGGIDGIYSPRVAASVAQMKQDMGLAYAFPGGSLEPKVVKALLNMDAYVTVNNGSDRVRSIQQWLNGRYVNRRDYYVIPCDGHHSRDVAKSMLLAIQYELGMADGVANGVFGPGTQSGLRSHPVSVGTAGTWAELFTAALVLNKRSVPFGAFTSEVAAATREFQSFAALPVTGNGDFQTWASLLVSHGDQSRKGEACDGITKITPDRAVALKAAGYTYIGRYLYNPSSTSLPEKQIQPGELATIKQYGLRCFPIYQTWARDASNFSYASGSVDSSNAIEWARIHGFKSGAIIYFAVDYDAMDAEVTDYILPYFRGVRSTVDELSGYRVGIYGPRNVCQRVSDAGLAVTSFVSDMSSGFSGNLGYPLPTNWAYDQIVTTTIGSGSGRIEIDNNIASGRDRAEGDFDPPQPNTLDLDVDLDKTRYRAAQLQAVQSYLTSIGVPETGGEGWKDKDWVTWNIITTTNAYDRVMEADWLFTNLARQLKIRKALIQAPVLWELRKLNVLDAIADDAVRSGNLNDCSTGYGQIFGVVALDARNHCIRQEYIKGIQLDRTDDLRRVWDALQDPHYNIPSVAYLQMHNAYMVGLNRPTLTTSLAGVQLIMERYNGDKTISNREQIEEYGAQVTGLYNVLENYNRLSRGQ